MMTRKEWEEHQRQKQLALIERRKTLGLRSERYRYAMTEERKAAGKNSRLMTMRNKRVKVTLPETSGCKTP